MLAKVKEVAVNVVKTAKGHAKTAYHYTRERLKERSTWMGVIAIATVAGYNISPEQGQAIASLGLTLLGGVAAGTKDPKQVVVVSNNPEQDQGSAEGKQNQPEASS